MVHQIHAGFKVGDFDEWKAEYDASAEARKATGEISYQVYRDVNDPNSVTVICQYPSVEGIQDWMDSPDLQERMKRAGITEMGQMMYLEEVDSGSH